MRFKNITLLLGALLMLSATSQAANVALGKKVYASSNQQPPELAVDDNLGTRWESKASDGDNQWFYVDLEKGTIIDHLKIVWEGAYGKHYKIHVADEITTEMALKLTDDDKTNDFATGWTEIAEINKTLSGFPASETIAVSTTDVVTARYVAVELIERGSSYGFSFWEFGVYDMAEEASKLSSIEITADKLEGSAADTYTLGYKFLDQYKVDYILTAEENASRQMIVSEGASVVDNKLTVTSRGTYTVKMKIGDIESNELKIEVKAEGANLALKKDIVFATEGSKNPENAVDGNLGSLWITDEPSGVENHEYDAVLVVDLGETYDVNCVHTSFEGASSADYTITFSTDNVTFSDPIPAFTVTNGIGMTNRHDWLTSEEAVKARYVKFHSTRAATQYGTKLYELEVYSNSKSELTSVMIAADKECGTPGDYTFTLTGLDQFGGNYDISGDKGVWKASAGLMNGNVLTAEEAGAYEVYYTAENGLQSNVVTVNVVNPKGDNLALNRPVTVSEGEQTGDSKPENAVDGVDAAASVWGAVEPAGSKDHTYDCWIVVELEKVFKIDAVKASWEGANSCRYTVEATVFNLNGAVVAHAESTATMSIATVQPGVYVVKAVKADGTVVTAKIVK